MDVYTHTPYPKFNNHQPYKLQVLPKIGTNRQIEVNNRDDKQAPSCFPEDLSKGKICIVEIHLLLSSNDQPNPLVTTELVNLGP